MINLFKSIIITFSMYSKIPMPYIKWDNKNLKYTMCFLPIIGIFISFSIYIWYKLCIYFEISNALFASGTIVISVLINGGIHMDGYLDTMDSLNSHLDKDKKLEILKDVHVGAFSVIMSNLYFIFEFGLWFELYKYNKIMIFAITCFIFSRIISGMMIIKLKCAKNTGLAYMFSDNADKENVFKIYILWFILCVLIQGYINLYILFILIFVVSFYIFKFKKMCYSNFGGITGDLSGYMLQIIELIVLVCSVIGGIFIK